MDPIDVEGLKALGFTRTETSPSLSDLPLSPKRRRAKGYHVRKVPKQTNPLYHSIKAYFAGTNVSVHGSMVEIRRSLQPYASEVLPSHPPVFGRYLRDALIDLKPDGVTLKHYFQPENGNSVKKYALSCRDVLPVKKKGSALESLLSEKKTQVEALQKEIQAIETVLSLL